MDTAVAVIIVPPFAGIDRPALGAHLLQACAASAGFRVDVLYANLQCGHWLGEALYESIAYAPPSALAGERFFARAAFGTPAFGYHPQRARDSYQPICDQHQFSWAKMLELEAQTESWCQRVAQQIVEAGYPIVGCSTTFEQSTASIAILRRVKQRNPQVITLLGGANCEGEMAKGWHALGAPIDYVFQGESELSFVTFLQQWAAHQLPSERIITGQPQRELDSLPLPNYSEFFEQSRAPDVPHERCWLVYESSRGCWWGEKQHCTFCGLNAAGMISRTKSPEVVLRDLKTLRERYGPMAVFMTDNILPHRYFNSLLPDLADELPDSRLFYEVKANLNSQQVAALVQAGIRVVQPGIESLNSRLLQLIKKGVSAKQNLTLLRDARTHSLELRWNLLYQIPGDQSDDYRQQLDIIRLIPHFEPPQGLFPITIDRFSPYFFAAERYEIRNLQPLAAYADVFPVDQTTADFAYHFQGDFPSQSREQPELIDDLRDAITHWQQAWRSGTRPTLTVIGTSENTFGLIDTRGIADCPWWQPLSREQAVAVLNTTPRKNWSEAHHWAHQHRLAWPLDNAMVGLATCEPRMLTELVI